MRTGRDLRLSPRNKMVIYWDTCVFLAWIKNEIRNPGEMDGVVEIVRSVWREEVVLITSTLTRAEILYSKVDKSAIEKYSNLMRRPNVLALDLDVPISELTSEIRDFYIATDFELLTPDAIHLATAIQYNADEFQTFDGSTPRKPRNSTKLRSGLLLLDGMVGTHRLAIKKPQSQQLDLLKNAITEGQPQALATTADVSTNAPPSPSSESAAAEPERSALGGEKQKSGQQASPPQGTTLPSDKV